MNRDIVRQVLVVVTVVSTIVVNGLASALPLNGQNTGDIADRFQVFFVPAGYVFSIWGLIYLSQIAFAVYQALPSMRRDPVMRRVGLPFILSGVANMGWIFAWHYNQFVLSLPIMVSLLVFLIICYRAIGGARGARTAGERWSVHTHFSIYLGWISVATVANATSVLDYVNWGGWGIDPALWAVIMLAVAGLLAWLMAWREGDWVYSLVLIWAFVGIAVKHGDTPLVANGAWLLAGAVALAAAVALLRRVGPSVTGRQLPA